MNHSIIGRLDSDLDLTIQLHPLRPIDDNTRRAAALAVCARAADAADACELLAMLGLQEPA